MSERRTSWGGLRAQALVSMSLLLLMAFGAAGVVVERLAAQNLIRSARDSGTQIADVVLETRPSRDSLERLVESNTLAAIRVLDSGDEIEVGEWGDARESGPDVIRVMRDGRRCDVRISRAFIEDELDRTRQLLWGFLGIGAIVILAFAYAMFTFLVIRPLRAIGVATERAADGDLASPIALLPRNEFGQVGRSFNGMLERLEDQREELEKSLAELRLANEELKSTQESLIRSEKLASVGQLAAGVAHEVGNPLAAMSGFNELLLEGELDEEESRELLERSQAQLERIQSIVRSLLDFSRDEKLVVGPVDLGRAVGESVRLARALPRAKGKTIEVQLADDMPAIDAVAAQLEQVLLNLLINAIDATHGAEAPRVEVTAIVREDSVILSVEDNGVGIAEEDRSRIFDPFFTTKDPGEGTGLGLSICSRIVEGFGGQLRLARLEPARFEIELRRSDS